MNFEGLLFDLDGTLLDFDPNMFIKTYLGAAAKFFIDLIPDSESFYKELLNSTDVMENADDPDTSSLEDFLIDFCPKFDARCDEIAQRFLEFYQTKYEVIKPLIIKVEGAKELLEDLRSNSSNAKIILATNPVFPYIATKRRMEWGDISEDYFDLITHAENSNFCKFNKLYWQEIVNSFDLKTKNCLVIGNDGIRDMGAKKYGFKTFLATPSAENIDKIQSGLEPDYEGTLADLRQLLLS